MKFDKLVTEENLRAAFEAEFVSTEHDKNMRVAMLERSTSHGGYKLMRAANDWAAWCDAANWMRPIVDAALKDHYCAGVTSVQNSIKEGWDG